MEKNGFVESIGATEHDVRVEFGTADSESGQLLIIKRSLCPSDFCN
jgi:hypothetical protein